MSLLLEKKKMALLNQEKAKLCQKRIMYFS